MPVQHVRGSYVVIIELLGYHWHVPLKTAPLTALAFTRRQQFNAAS
jgi:hypothetical protein